MQNDRDHRRLGQRCAHRRDHRRDREQADDDELTRRHAVQHGDRAGDQHRDQRRPGELLQAREGGWWSDQLSIPGRHVFNRKIGRHGNRGSQRCPSEGWDAIRRTRLAAERTELAWWRTALTSIAVAIAVGRVVPELSGTQYRVALSSSSGSAGRSTRSRCSATARLRSRRVEAASTEGRMIQSSRVESRYLMAGGVSLCLATVALIAALPDGDKPSPR